MSDLRLGDDGVPLRIDVERCDGELCQRHRQTTELQDDAAHVERTSNEVFVAQRADVEPASTSVQVSFGGRGCHQDAVREIVVQASSAGTQVANSLTHHRHHPTRKSTCYPEQTHPRISQRQTVHRLGNGDDLSVQEQASAGRKQRSVHMHEPSELAVTFRFTNSKSSNDNYCRYKLTATSWVKWSKATSPPHVDGSVVFAWFANVRDIMIPSFRVHIQNGILIGSAGFAHLMGESPYTLHWAAALTLKISPLHWAIRTSTRHTLSLGPPETKTQTASRSVQPFSRAHESRQTDRHTTLLRL